MPAPDVIGRHRLGRKLGSGGFAVVWLARDEQLDTSIAIKVMAENWADRLDLRERFLTEARMLRRASSRRIVQVFDIGELPDGRPYMVMEFADRGTLADRTAAHGPLPPAEALRATAEVARGVAELHAAGIVHRDVKPSNVLIASGADGGERLLVADLGVAKNLAQASGLTMSVGSAGYMAPEQTVPNAGVDVRADVYGLGALASHLLTAQVPGPAGQVWPKDSPATSLPPSVRRVLLRALEPDPDKRWPDATTFAERLDAVADELEPRAPARRRRRRPGRRSLIAAVLVVAAAVGGVVWGLPTWRNREDPDVSVQDRTGAVSLTVPREWARERVATGWDPAVLGLTAAARPGVLISDDVGHWGDLEWDVNGAFAGSSPDPGLGAAVDRITHPGCVDQGVRVWSNATWTGRIHRWEDCRGGGRSVDDVRLSARATGTQVYLQVRQDGGKDVTEQIVGGVRAPA